MPVVKYESLKKQLNDITLINIAMLYGEQTYLILQIINSIVKSAQKLELEIIRFMGENISINDLYDSIESFSFNTNKRLVLIKDIEISKLSNDEFDILISIANNPNPSTIIIFYQTSAKIDLRTSRAKKLYNEIGNNGLICDVSINNINLIKDGLSEYAKKNGKILSYANATFLIERSSTKYDNLINEMDKLISFSSGNEITKDDILISVIPSFNSSAFELAKNILSNNFNTAFTILDELFQLRQDGILIVGALSMAFIDIYRAKLAIFYEKSADDILTDFSYAKNRQFVVSKALKDCSKFQVNHIKSCLGILLKTDSLMKSSRINQHILLEKVVSTMLVSSKNQG